MADEELPEEPTQLPSHPGFYSLDAGMLVAGESPRPATQVAEEDYRGRGPSISPRAIPLSPLGAPCWATQSWPYGKPILVIHAAGGVRNAWGDYTIQSTGGAPLAAGIDIEKVNAERKALAMPLLEQEVY